MKRRLCILLSALAFFCLFSGCSKDEENETEKENHLSEEVDPDWPDGSIEDLERFDIDAYDRETYMVPVWNDGGIASAETVFVLAEKDGSVEPIQLLYPAKQIISVRNYGLDIRYEEGKEHLTGKAWQPFTLRYVGEEYARAMHDNGLCMEEMTFNKE